MVKQNFKYDKNDLASTDWKGIIRRSFEKGVRKKTRKTYRGRLRRFLKFVARANLPYEGGPPPFYFRSLAPGGVRWNDRGTSVGDCFWATGCRFGTVCRRRRRSSDHKSTEALECQDAPAARGNHSGATRPAVYVGCQVRIRVPDSFLRCTPFEAVKEGSERSA